MKVPKLMKFKMPFLPFAQLFFSVSIMFATWIIYIPQIVEKLNMSKGELGTALMFAAIGALVSNPSARWLVKKFGPGKMALISISSQTMIVVGYFIVPSAILLGVMLFLFGFCGAITQISVNTLITLAEKQKNISIMSTCHGFWSLGGIMASGFGTILLILLNHPLLHILLMAGFVLVLQLVFAKDYLNYRGNYDKKTKTTYTNIYKNPLIWAFALIGLCVMVSEGAIADWSALYLRDVALSDKNILGLGYAGFSLAMATGRFFGDKLSIKIGSVQIIISGFVLGCLGLLVVLSASPFLSVVGFFVTGLGFSIIVPEVYRLSAGIDAYNPSAGIAMISISANFGFLVGPFTIGAIAEKFGLQTSFVVVLVLVLAGLLTAIAIYLKRTFALFTGFNFQSLTLKPFKRKNNDKF
ncbi:MAG: MFS transporter [Bacteroidales bacterium]